MSGIYVRRPWTCQVLCSEKWDSVAEEVFLRRRTAERRGVVPLGVLGVEAEAPALDAEQRLDGRPARALPGHPHAEAAVVSPAAADLLDRRPDLVGSLREGLGEALLEDRED